MAGKRFSAVEIASRLERSIVENAVVPGVRLPSAGELAVQYAVSPKTADRALDHLARKGLIARQRGRGNFVRDNRPPDKRPRVGFLWWGLSEEIETFHFNPWDIFRRTVCRLFDERRIDYDLYRENIRYLEQPANREKKYDIFVVPSALIERPVASTKTACSPLAYSP